VTPVVLLTDFGFRDHYVGVLHAVLAREAPSADRIDLCHEVEAGDVWGACFRLWCAWEHLPDGAVVLAVVDPGVGTARRAVAASADGRWIVAPDNGLATFRTPVASAVELDWRAMDLSEPSHTFHGRDVFAPAAARLARGDAAGSLGPPVEPDRLAGCPLPAPEIVAGGVRAPVLHVDRFGNVVCNVRVDDLPAGAHVRLPSGGEPRRVGTYGQAGPDEVVWYEGSSGLLELAVNRGSAAVATGLERGMRLEVVFAR
jgi:S-adenosylmethionine hydrolase